MNNLMLYIKRAEISHTMEYIINAFKNNMYGEVKEVHFINKTGQNNIQYNGAIVIFNKWYMNDRVKTLINEMNNSSDGSTKLFHDIKNKRFWFVNIHKEKLIKNEEIHNVSIYGNNDVNMINNMMDTMSLKIEKNKEISEKEKITELETVIASMASQLQYYQLNNEKNERIIMNHELNIMQKDLYINELLYQLENEKYKITKLNEEIEKSKNEANAAIERYLYRASQSMYV